MSLVLIDSVLLAQIPAPRQLDLAHMLGTVGFVCSLNYQMIEWPQGSEDYPGGRLKTNVTTSDFSSHRLYGACSLDGQACSGACEP